MPTGLVDIWIRQVSLWRKYEWMSVETFEEFFVRREREKKHDYYISNREHIAERKRTRHAKNPEKDVQRSRKWRNNKLGAMASRPRPDFCEACGNPQSGGKKVLHFDHCHKTKEFRGWLCHWCNLALGNVKDDPERLKQLISYLEKYDTKAL